MNTWAFCGTFVELLHQCADADSAATVARVSVHKLDAPANLGEKQIKAHLTEMSGGPRTRPRPGDPDRIQALVDELCTTVISTPGVLDRSTFRVLEGMLVVARAGS